MDFDAERVWRGTCVVEMVHVLKRDGGRKEIVVVVREGEDGGLADWLTKAAALFDAARRRMEDPDGD